MPVANSKSIHLFIQIIVVNSLRQITTGNIDIKYQA